MAAVTPLIAAHLDPAGVAVEYGRGEWRRANHLTYLSRRIAETLWRPIRLIVSIPVRHGKTELAGHWAPIWFLLNRPRTGRVLISTYNDDFAAFFGGRVRDRLRETPRLGLQIKRDDSAAASWSLNSGANLHTAGTGGSITGRGFDLIIIDDPVKDFESAYSARQRQIVWDWFTGTLSSRLQRGGSIIIIQSRWHEDDLVGRLIGTEYESEKYEIIDFPAIATAPDLLGRQEGDALWPEEWPLDELARRRTAVGSVVWQAQYQGSPTTPEGNVFKRDWWRYIDAGDVPPADVDLRIWDLGYTENAGDWTCGVRLQYTYRTGQIVIRDVDRFRYSSGPRDARIKATAERDGHGVIIGLPGDLGQIEHFQEHVLQGYRIEDVQETSSKLVRVLKSGFPARVEAGDVFLVRDTPDRPPWNADFVNEHADFPGGRHDDQVDPSANGYSLLTDPRFVPLAFA